MLILALGIEAAILALPILQQLVIDDALVTADANLLALLTLATACFLVGQALRRAHARFCSGT
jgi:ABC-type bacteriocin/lantibiotic exporter with double-glycine peptidase domain